MKKLALLDKPLEGGLTGAEILTRIQRGHIVRRECWRKGFFIRICNESGIDENGFIIFDERETQLYTAATDGYFMHLGFSSQPFKRKASSRQGEGLGALFAKDWQDYGFVTEKEFDEITASLKETLRKENAIEHERIQYEYAVRNGQFVGSLVEYKKAVKKTEK